MTVGAAMKPSVTPYPPTVFPETDQTRFAGIAVAQHCHGPAGL